MSKKKFNSVISMAVLVAAGIGTGYVIINAPVWLSSTHKEGNYAAYFPNQHNKIVIYGNKTCQFCQRTREYLRAKNVEFSDFDVIGSSKAGQEFKALGGGSVPIVLIGNRMIRGYLPREFDEALAELKSK